MEDAYYYSLDNSLNSNKSTIQWNAEVPFIFPTAQGKKHNDKHMDLPTCNNLFSFKLITSHSMLTREKINPIHK